MGGLSIGTSGWSYVCWHGPGGKAYTGRCGRNRLRARPPRAGLAGGGA